MVRAIVKYCAMPRLPFLSLVLIAIAVAVEANPRANDRRFLGISKLIFIHRSSLVAVHSQIIRCYTLRECILSLPAVIFLFRGSKFYTFHQNS